MIVKVIILESPASLTPPATNVVISDISLGAIRLIVVINSELIPAMISNHLYLAASFATRKIILTIASILSFCFKDSKKREKCQTAFHGHGH